MGKTKIIAAGITINLLVMLLTNIVVINGRDLSFILLLIVIILGIVSTGILYPQSSKNHYDIILPMFVGAGLMADRIFREQSYWVEWMIGGLIVGTTLSLYYLIKNQAE